MSQIDLHAPQFSKLFFANRSFLRWRHNRPCLGGFRQSSNGKRHGGLLRRNCIAPCIRSSRVVCNARIHSQGYYNPCAQPILRRARFSCRRRCWSIPTPGYGPYQVVLGFIPIKRTDTKAHIELAAEGLESDVVGYLGRADKCYNGKTNQMVCRIHCLWSTGIWE